LIGYLGTDNDIEIEKEVEEGNEKYRQILEAMAYQISKEIGAYATVLKGKVDAIFLTGGLAYDKFLTGWIRKRIAFIAPVYMFPGEGEMEALAEAGLRVLKDMKSKILISNMKLSGFSFVRNGIKLYYPVVETIKSILPLVDEFVIAVGKGDEDDTSRKKSKK